MKLKNIDLICLSHLRWGFVFQRPQHLMSRFALNRRVYFFEEPLFEAGKPHLRASVCATTGVHVHTPVLQPGTPALEVIELQRELLSSVISGNGLDSFMAWYYTPMAWPFASHLHPEVTVYDCMDELSAFAGAPAEMRDNEQALFHKADLVFTGGASLYENKREKHSSVYLFPSSVDTAHFARARYANLEPDDQAHVPCPRLGYAGVIDERMDLLLLKEAAALRPDWHFVMLGPVVKINPLSLPHGSNIHYLGMKPYRDLPAYLSGWDIGMLPFALNESTRFISPTKTPEYLAAGLPVVSTAIRDVVTPYGDLGFVRVVYGPDQFVTAVDFLLKNPATSDFRASVDGFLAKSSWDKTWSSMNALIEEKLILKDLPITCQQPSVRTGVPAKGITNV